MMNSTQGRTRARFIAIIAAIPFVALGALGAAGSASASQPVDGTNQVTYCHATGSTTNPYVVITTDKAAVVNAHSKHQDERDIIPAFSYSVGKAVGTFAGLNLQNANILANNCNVPSGYAEDDTHTTPVVEELVPDEVF